MPSDRTLARILAPQRAVRADLPMIGRMEEFHSRNPYPLEGKSLLVALAKWVPHEAGAQGITKQDISATNPLVLDRNVFTSHL